MLSLPRTWHCCSFEIPPRECEKSFTVLESDVVELRVGVDNVGDESVEGG
jgi:hypothetical protein